MSNATPLDVMKLNRTLAIDKELGDEAVMRIAANADVQAVAQAIVNGLYDHKSLVLRAMGANAVNQAAKSIAIARGYVAHLGADLNTRIGFTTVEDINGKAVSAIIMRVSAQ